MKFLTRIKTLIGSALVAATLTLGAAATPAAAQAVIINPAAACPVPAYELRSVLSGMYGVDGLDRPVNQFGFPVDVYGNCLTQAPVGEIFNYQPAPYYINFLWMHYGYHYYYNPGFVHLYHGPGVHVYGHYGAVPRGHSSVIIQHNYHAPVQTVRPGVPTSTVRPGAPTSTVHPGHAGPPAAAPSLVTPPHAVAPTSTFHRPTAAAPSAFTPPHAAAPTSTFSRPSAPPSMVTPSRSMGHTSTFSRPHR